VIFSLALVITLVPAHLLELRYFSPAVVIAVISSSPSPQCGTAGVGVEVNKKEAAVPSKGLEDLGTNDPKDRIPFQSLFDHSYLQFNACMSCLVNVVTISLFLYRPFQWNDGTTARFMY
jgi:hypothetical protein